MAGDLAACGVAALAAAASPSVAVAVAVILLTVHVGFGLYRSRLALSVLDDLPRLVQAWLITVAVFTVLTGLNGSVEQSLPFLAGVGALTLTFRVVSYGVVRLTRHTGLVTHPTVVVGSGAVGRDIVTKLQAKTSCGLAPIGFLDSRDDADPPPPLPLPLLGGPADLTSVLRDHEPRVLVIADGQMSEPELVRMVRACHRHHCELFVLPRLHEITHVGDDMDFVGHLPLVRLRRAAYRSWAWRAKRMVDLVVSGLAIVLLAPVLLACALAVRLEGGPGVIFRQERVGVDGRRFHLLKFRSMRPSTAAESATNWSIATDQRVGPVGRLLRKLSLDELPQLVNILRGEMSLVGPRPERPHFVAEFDRLYGDYSARHRVPCGLTGWAQIHGLRGDTSIAERAHFDNFYIENWSLWLDLKVVLRTAVSIFTAPGR